MVPKPGSTVTIDSVRCLPVLRRSTRLSAVNPEIGIPPAQGPSIKRKRVSASSIIAAPSDLSESNLTDVEDPGDISRKRRAKKPKNKSTTQEDRAMSALKRSSRKQRAPKPEPVYIIPDVERKETAFNGRLGYACLNTIFRNKKPATESVFCSRTCRIETIKQKGIDWVKELGRKNVEDLLTILQWNEDNHIRFMRLSSEMFPFASHAEYGYSLDYCAPLLSRVGVFANKYGHRLTAHPGQYTQLGSPKKEVVDAAVRELVYHCEMMDKMGIGADGVMVVHGGGMYEDKTATLERIKKTITEVLPQNVRDRLVLENDEICYNAEELLPLCAKLDVPLVFDYHHDALNPSSISPSTIIERANTIWSRRGIKPKQHLSEARPGAVTLMERRAHADRCESLPQELGIDMDLMIEAKDKEQAVLHLYRMYGLQPVDHASLRPPNENQTKETKGRKSTKRARAKEERLENEHEAQGKGADEWH